MALEGYSALLCFLSLKAFASMIVLKSAVPHVRPFANHFHVGLFLPSLPHIQEQAKFGFMQFSSDSTGGHAFEVDRCFVGLCVGIKGTMPHQQYQPRYKSKLVCKTRRAELDFRWYNYSKFRYKIAAKDKARGEVRELFITEESVNMFESPCPGAID